MGEEDELESRTTPIQEGEDDEDITSSEAPADPLTIMKGLMTHFHIFENRLIPNDIILLRNIGEGHEGLRGRGGREDDQQGCPTETGGPIQHDFESASASRTSLP